jgi:hypothetical protein
MMSVAVFFFLAAASIAFFAFLITAHWIDTRAAERQVRDRLALLRKIADQPAESARLMADLLREDEARTAKRERARAREARRENIQGGMVVVAVGVGLAIMLAAVEPSEQVWTVGFIPVLIGLVSIGFALFGEPAAEAAADDR